MGKSTPAGVRSFGHTSKPDKGRKQPETVGGGHPNAVEGRGGKGQTVTLPTGGSASYPRGVSRGDGTEDRGSNPTTSQAKVKGPGGSKMDTSARPSGVHTFTGLSAPAPRRS